MLVQAVVGEIAPGAAANRVGGPAIRVQAWGPAATLGGKHEPSSCRPPRPEHRRSGEALPATGPDAEGDLGSGKGSLGPGEAGPVPADREGSVGLIWPRLDRPGAASEIKRLQGPVRDLSGFGGLQPIAQRKKDVAQIGKFRELETGPFGKGTRDAVGALGKGVPILGQ